MEITCTTIYDKKAVTAMARGLRKSIRKKHSRRSHIIGWIVVILGLLLSFLPRENAGIVNVRSVVTWLIVLVLIVVLVWEDWINGWFARKRMLPGMEQAATLFTREGYITVTQVGTTQWKYDNILMLAESKDYFIFIFSQSHAQVYDKKGLSGATVQEFVDFLVEVTGKQIQKI